MGQLVHNNFYSRKIPTLHAHELNKLLKLITLSSFSKCVCYHVRGTERIPLKLFLFNVVGQKLVFDVDSFWLIMKYVVFKEYNTPLTVLLDTNIKHFVYSSLSNLAFLLVTAL